MTRNRRRLPLPGALCAAVACLWTATGVHAAEARYRVEVIVFRNLDVPATPQTEDRPRTFSGAFELDAAAPPEAPVALDKRDGAFANLWSRLDRLADYQPLVRLTYEQTLYDYHPPVRLHGEEVLAETLNIPGDMAYIDMERKGGAGWFDDYMAPLYRLDGTIQLRRSRFLHVELDLEYRLDGPAWARVFPGNGPGRLEEGFEWVGAPPAPDVPAEPAPNVTPGDKMTSDTGALAPPFELHRLQQSRQVRTDTMQYFDTAYLGAIVRVTPIADAAP